MRRIAKEKLIEMYATMTNKELCDKLGITNPTLVKILRGAGIPLKGRDRKVSSNNIIVTE